MTDAKTDHSWRREWAWLAAFVPLSIAFTWPLAARFTTALAGDDGDNWQTIWGFDWIRRALASGQNPYFTHDLWHPSGVTLVFQTFDLPDAIWSAPLAALFGPWVAFNAVMLGAFVFSGWSMYALSRGMGASRPASFFAGCAFTFSTYHFAHTLGHMHIVAMQWVPLFALAWWRCLEGAEWRWAIAGGMFLALASLSSWYYLLGSFVIAFGTGIAWLVRLIRTRTPGFTGAVGRVLALCATYLVLIGPLGLEMMRVRQHETINGEHLASFYSADLESFYKPNAAQLLAAWSQAHRHWTGNPAETAPYLGAVLVFLVVLGLLLRARQVGAYLLVAVFGVVLAMGPWLHVAGRIMPDHVLPYSWIEKVFPLIQFTGVPVRLGFAATFGLAAALAPALDALVLRLRWAIVVPFAVLAIAEHTPHAFVTFAYPEPKPMLDWAKDPTKFAVLDVCRDMRHLWHQSIHHHPIIGGYLTRTPARLETQLDADPVAGPLKAWDPPQRRRDFAVPSLYFPDTVIDGDELPQLNFELSGDLNVTQPGLTSFSLDSDPGLQLLVDNRIVVDTRRPHRTDAPPDVVSLTAGPHHVVVRAQKPGGISHLIARWAPPGEQPRVIGGSDAPAGFRGMAQYHRRETLIPRAQALSHLRALDVRYIVQDQWDSRYLTEKQLGLRPMYQADGVRIYEVPSSEPPPMVAPLH